MEYVRPESDSLPPEKKERKRRKKASEVFASGTAALEAEKTRRKPGRPKGSRNKKTLEREALEKSLSTEPRRGRGRPKGSKNKKTLEREQLEQASNKRGRGRPKGTRNRANTETY